jgi:hypothetical protein
MVPATGADRIELPDGVALLPVKTLEEAMEVGLAHS